METRANFVAVGLVTLLVIIGAFGFIYWTSQFSSDSNLVPLQIRIKGAATGLGPGSDVLFNGVKVGKIQNVDFDKQDPRLVNAIANVRADIPLRSDTRATLGVQGLTGVAYISLRGGSPKADMILHKEPGVVPSINADELVVTDILETVRDAASRVNSVAGDLAAFVEENRPPLTRSVQNIETFSESLSKNSEGVNDFLASLATAATSLTKFSEKLDGSIEGMENIIKAVKPEQVSMTVENISKFTSELRDSGTKIASIVENVDASSKKIGAIIDKLDNERVATGVNDFSAAATDAKQAMADIKSATSALNGRQDDIKKIVTNVTEMSERLNKASGRVDGVLQKVESFLGAGDSGAITGEISKTLAEFRNVAQSVKANIESISKGLNRFSNRGLQDVETLIKQSSRTVQRFDSLVRGLEKNPQRIITGGDEVRQYQGRPRR